MRGQFDKLANLPARRASRRRVVRGLLGGLAGAVAATVLVGSQIVAVEASTPTLGTWSVQRSAGLNQQAPVGLQSTIPASAGLSLNQAAVRLEETPPDLKQIQDRLFKARPGLQQQLGQQIRANASQRPASANSTRRQGNTQQQVSSGARSRPTSRQGRPSSIQGQPGSEQARPTLQQILADLSQSHPRFNQRGFPALNHADPR